MTLVGKIVLALVGLAVAYFDARAKGGDTASATVSKALRNALDEIAKADAARLAAADAARRDPAGILRDDDGWRRD
jgi:hypothetical protein